MFVFGPTGIAQGVSENVRIDMARIVSISASPPLRARHSVSFEHYLSSVRSRCFPSFYPFLSQAVPLPCPLSHMDSRVGARLCHTPTVPDINGALVLDTIGEQELDTPGDPAQAGT